MNDYYLIAPTSASDLKMSAAPLVTGYSSKGILVPDSIIETSRKNFLNNISSSNSIHVTKANIFGDRFDVKDTLVHYHHESPTVLMPIIFYFSDDGKERIDVVTGEVIKSGTPSIISTGKRVNIKEVVCFLKELDSNPEYFNMYVEAVRELNLFVDDFERNFELLVKEANREKEEMIRQEKAAQAFIDEFRVRARKRFEQE